MPTRPKSFAMLMRERRPQPVHEDRPDSHARGYDATWRRVRLAYLRQHPCCALCGQPASEVHHIKRLAVGGAKSDEDNLQALCKPCHSRVTRGTT